MLFPSFFLSEKYKGSLAEPDPVLSGQIKAPGIADPDDKNLLEHAESVGVADERYRQLVEEKGVWLPASRLIKFGFAIATAAELKVSHSDRMHTLSAEDARQLGGRVAELGIATALMHEADPQVYTPDLRYTSFNNRAKAGALANTSPVASALAAADGTSSLEHIQVLSGLYLDGAKRSGCTRHLRLVTEYDQNTTEASLTFGFAESDHLLGTDNLVLQSSTQQFYAYPSHINNFAAPILNDRNWPIPDY